MTTEELKIWKRLNECESVKKVFGVNYLPLRIGDFYCCPRKTGISRVEDIYTVPKNAIWIPPLYDPIRPERSLIGMVESLGYTINLYQNLMLLPAHRWVCELLKDCIKINVVCLDRPDLALAQAIILNDGEGMT